MKRLLGFLIALAIVVAPVAATAATCATGCDKHVTKKQNFFVDFANWTVPITLTAPATLATAADNQVDYVFIDSQYLEYIQQAANADIVFTRDGTGVSWNGATVKGGWIIPNDNTDNDGIEISRGLTSGISQSLFTLGTDAAPGNPLEISLTFAIPDVSDYDVAIVGWRKVAAYGAAILIPTTGATGPDLYTDVAAFNVNAGDIYTDTVLNGAGGAGLSAVDTTLNWADGEVHTLTVKVSAARVVTWYVDNTLVTATQAGVNSGFKFDASDEIMPFIAFTKGAAASDTPPILLSLRIGYQN